MTNDPQALRVAQITLGEALNEYLKSLKPAQRLALFQGLHAGLHQRGIVQHFIRRSRFFELPPDSIVIVGRAEVGAGHAIQRAVHRSWMLPEAMMGDECSAQGASRISGGGLHPDAPEAAVAGKVGRPETGRAIELTGLES